MQRLQPFCFEVPGECHGESVSRSALQIIDRKISRLSIYFGVTKSVDPMLLSMAFDPASESEESTPGTESSLD